MFGALPSRIARRSTGNASPSISRKTIPGASVATRSFDRRAIRSITRSEYVSSSSTPNRTPSAMLTAAATSATASAAQNPSTERSPPVTESAASSIRASSTRTSTNPNRSVSGSRSAATIGGSSALSTPITAAAPSAPPKLFTVAPGRSSAATISARVWISHAPARRIVRMRGRFGVHVGCSPYACVAVVISGQTLQRA